MLEKLEVLPDIGPEVAENVVHFFRKQEDMIQDLLSELELKFENQDSTSIQGKWS